MSPISPLVLSYHASGGPTTVARPTSASVIASMSWCDATEVLLSKGVAARPQVSHPDPDCMSGKTP
jgi:hypothetical protein